MLRSVCRAASAPGDPALTLFNSRAPAPEALERSLSKLGIEFASPARTMRTAPHTDRPAAEVVAKVGWGMLESFSRVGGMLRGKPVSAALSRNGPAPPSGGIPLPAPKHKKSARPSDRSDDGFVLMSMPGSGREKAKKAAPLSEAPVAPKRPYPVLPSFVCAATDSCMPSFFLSPSLVTAARQGPPPLPVGVDSFRLEELSAREWAAALDAEGRVLDPDFIRDRVFHGGVAEAVRGEVWQFLVGYMPWDSTAAERAERRAAKRVQYEAIRAQWMSIGRAQEGHFAEFRDRRHRIEKDVPRTDRHEKWFRDADDPNMQKLYRILLTYAFFNYDVGYVQGMADLLSPILVSVDGEADAFWVYAEVMERRAPSFDKDQVGMNTQLVQLRELVRYFLPDFYDYLEGKDALNLFFCFRWLLVLFKREMPYESVFLLWSAFWTDFRTPHFHLFVCLAVVQSQQRTIVRKGLEFDEILLHINELSGKIDVTEMLLAAERLVLRGLADPAVPPAIAELLQSVPPRRGMDGLIADEQRRLAASGAPEDKGNTGDPRFKQNMTPTLAGHKATKQIL